MGFMINYNLIMYIVVGLMFGGFWLFLFLEMEKRKKDRELFRQEQLHNSFMKAKNDSR